MTELEITLTNNKRELSKKERALKNLMDLLEDEKYQKEIFNEKYFELVDDIETIKSRIKSIKEEKGQIKKIVEENVAFTEFIKNNKKWLSDIQIQLMNLKPADKKRLFESILQGKIILNYEYSKAEGIPPHVAERLPAISLNTYIFQSFMDEGKIASFNQNGPRDYPLFVSYQ